MFIHRAYIILCVVWRASKEGEKIGTIIWGIKGSSPLHNYILLVIGVPLDYMHCVLEGVVRKLGQSQSITVSPFQYGGV